MSFWPWQKKQPVDVGSNEKLERLICDLAEDDTPESRKRFHEELLRTQLLMAIRSASDSSPALMVSSRDGRQMFAFHNRDAFNTWLPELRLDGPRGGNWKWREVDATPIKTQDLCRFAIEHRITSIVINGGGPQTGCLLPFEIECLANGSIPKEDGGRSVPAGTEMHFGTPARVDSNLVEAIRAACMASSGMVKSAHLLLTKASEKGKPRLLVVLQLAQGATAEHVMPPFNRAVLDIVADVDLDLAPVSSGDELHGYALEIGTEIFSAR